jgi:glycine hydroxymethyltransferase
LIAGKQMKDPFEFCDVVTSTTHKTLRGPRSGLIFGKKHLMDDIDFAVFPSLQGGPHNHQIAGVATQLKEVCSPEWPTYCKQVMANSTRLAEVLMSKGHKLATNGTDNHVILWDLRPHGITGSKMELIGDAVGITLNKNTIHGDKNALSPGAVRIGTPALTSRGFTEADFDQVAVYLDKALELAKKIQDEVGKPLKNFRPALENNADVDALKAEIKQFAQGFPMPGL